MLKVQGYACVVATLRPACNTGTPILNKQREEGRKEGGRERGWEGRKKMEREKEKDCIDESPQTPYSASPDGDIL